MPAHNLRGRCWARRLWSSFVGRLRNPHGWLYGDGVTNVSHLSALVNVSCEKVLPTVVCSGEALKVGGGVEVPALIATIAPRPLKQRTASHTFPIMANPRGPNMRIDRERRTESGT
jgi:hypothetical protein